MARAHLFWHSCCEEHCSHAYLLAPSSVSVDEKPRRHADNEVFCSTSIESSRKSCAQLPHQSIPNPYPSPFRSECAQSLLQAAAARRRRPAISGTAALAARVLFSDSCFVFGVYSYSTRCPSG